MSVERLADRLLGKGDDPDDDDDDLGLDDEDTPSPSKAKKTTHNASFSATVTTRPDGSILISPNHS